MTAPGWSEPLTAKYEGGEAGTLIVRAAHTELDLPATMQAREEDGAVTISGFDDVETMMPDLEELDKCTAEKVPAEFADDADFYNVTSMSCLETVAMGAGPVAVKASVRIGILSPEDVIIEMRQTYLAPSTGPGGVMYIETYPSGCKVDAGLP